MCGGTIEKYVTRPLARTQVFFIFTYFFQILTGKDIVCTTEVMTLTDKKVLYLWLYFRKTSKFFAFLIFAMSRTATYANIENFLKSFVFHNHPLQKYFLQQEHKNLLVYL